MQPSDGIIIILSYPDTVVRPAYWEPLSGFWHKLGVGGKHAVQAGHAALLLLEKKNPEINYFDFGRYITSYGNGRVRSKETDVELHVPLKATYKNNNLTNLEEILLWLENNPKKTHGEGRLVATINTDISFKKANKFIQNLIDKKEIPYGTFIKNGSNCARFVTDTIIHATTNKKTQKSLEKSNYFTPSPIGNVIKATSTNKIYTVLDQKITEYKNRSIVKEYKATFFNKFNNEPNVLGTEKPNLEVFSLENATWLGGIGSGAWFKVEEQINNQTYKIARYTADGQKDFESIFKTNKIGFNINTPFVFKYPSNCLEMSIQQKEKNFIFKKIKN